MGKSWEIWQTTMANHGKTQYKSQVSIAMLNYQRVASINRDLTKQQGFDQPEKTVT